MVKTVWLSSLGSSEETVKNLISQLRTYGLEVKGHFWEDNVEKMAWAKPRGELIKPDVTLWLILASLGNLVNPSIRYGLSLLTLTVQAKRGLSFPTVVLLLKGEPPLAETLPMPLKGIDFLSLTDPGMAAKLVTRIHTPVKETPLEYRIDTYGNPQIGQWFEVGPMNSTWSGAMFGVAEGEILFQAVGPRGSLPDQSVLHYPLKGLKLSLGAKEYIAWAVQNEIDPKTSYFVKVEGLPSSILFGPYSSQEAAEVYVLTIK